MSPFADRLRTGPPLLLDGGLATELERRGEQLDPQLWSAALLLDRPGSILAVHQAYVEAGADVLVTASYQADLAGFMGRGLDRAEALDRIAASVRLARQAAGARPDVFVAGSVGTIGASFADGAEYRGRYGLPATRYREHHAPRMDALLEAGADVLALETLPDLDEAAVLVRLVEERRAEAWLAFTCADGGHLRGGTPIRDAWALASSSTSVLAAGVNCTAPHFVSPLLEHADGIFTGPRVAYPNSGEGWDAHTRAWTGSAHDHDLSSLAAEWLARGVRLLGGCCRVGPDEIARLRRTLDDGPTGRALRRS